MFKDINIYSLGFGATILVLGGYLQSLPSSPALVLSTLCFVLALYLILNPVLKEKFRYQQQAERSASLFKDNENLFNAVVEESGEAIITLNTEGDILSFNTSAEKLFDYKAWDIIGKKFSTLIDIELHPHMAANSPINGSQKLTAIGKNRNKFLISLNTREVIGADNKTTLCFIQKAQETNNAVTDFTKSQEFHELVIDTIPDYVIVKDTDHNIITANSAFLNLFPHNVRNNLIGKKSTDYYDKQLTQEIIERDELALKTGSCEGEEQITFPWGGARTLLTKKVRFHGTDNEPFILGIARDITELKQKEQQIKESEKRLALAIEGGGLGFWDWDIASGKMEFSEGWLQMLGYRKSELKENFESWMSLIHIDDLEETKEKIDDYLSGRSKNFEAEFRMLHKDGSWHYILSRGKVFEFDERGNPVRAVGTHSNITDRLRQRGRVDFLIDLIILSNEMDTQEQFLRSALAIICKYIGWPIGHAFVLNDDQETFRSSGCWYIGDGNLDLTDFRTVTEEKHYNPGQDLPGTISMTGEPLWIEDLSKEHCIDRLEGLENSPLRTAFAFPIKVYSKTRVILEFFSTESVDENNELFVLWNAVGSQLSRAIEKYINEKRKQTHLENVKTAKEEAKAAEKRAKNANRMKSEFLTNMSHEIRTPLNGIIGAADLLKRTSITEDQGKYLDVIHNSGDTLLVLINDILDLSKIEAGELEIVPEAVSIRDIVEATMQSISPKAESKNIELVINISNQVPDQVLADEIRLKQILINLLGNAVKFVEEGYIAITVTAEEECDENIPLKFSVKDTGIGIPADKLKTIFDKFSQVDATTTKKYGGTGLGLTITQRLVDMMEGEIGVLSEVGSGTEFWFELKLPVIEKHNTPAPQPSSAEQTSPRVLIVDDMEISRQFLSAALTEMSVTNDTAPNVMEGLKKLLDAAQQGNPYDILLVDYFMPNDTGATLAEKVRNSEDLSNLKIVLLSATSKLEAAGITPDTKEDNLFDDYLIKPVSNQKLLEKINNISLSKNAETPDEVDKDIEAVKPEEKTGEDNKLNANILLVENELVNQMVATDMLENLGCTVTLAENGQEAVDILAENNNFEVVLMDCMMPLMDGFDATRNIRTREQEQEIPRQTIIAMTANAMTGEKEKCLECGMDDYLSKPVKEADLFAKLKQYIS